MLVILALLTMLVTLGATMLPAGPAQAQTVPGSGGFCSDPVAVCTGGVHVPATSPTPGTGPRTTYWVIELESNPLLCQTPDAMARRFELRRVGTDELIFWRTECLGPATAGSAQPLPTLEEVWDVAPLGFPDLFTDPGCRGLVGIENNLWAVANPPVVATVDLNGWTLAVDALPIAWRWRIEPREVDTPDGSAAVAGAEYSSRRPGSAEAPVAAHVFEAAGRYGFSVVETWTGTFTATSGALTLGPIPLGLVELTTTAPYRVVEVQAVLIGSDGPSAGAPPVDPTAGLACSA